MSGFLFVIRIKRGSRGVRKMALRCKGWRMMFFIEHGGAADSFMHLLARVYLL
jgi:hypothetical protein